MVDATSRSQLIQEQIRQLQQNAPPPLTDAERNQIMKGRKSQKDIDAGREAIATRQKAIEAHQNAVGRLFDQLTTAQQEEAKAATAAEREKAADPWKQTYYPIGAGAAAGYGVGEIANRIVGAASKSRAKALLEIGEELGPTSDLTQSQLNRSRAVGAAAAAEKVAPTGKFAKLGGMAGRAATYGIPSALVFREWNRYQQMANDESLPFSERQSYQQMANFFLGTGTGIGAEGGMRLGNTVLPEGAGKAMARVYTARDLARRFDERDARAAAPTSAIEPAPAAQPPRPFSGQTIDAEALPAAPRPPLPSSAPAALPAPAATLPPAPEAAAPPPPASPPAEPPAPIPNRERLRNAAEAATGNRLSPKIKKEAHYNMMKKALTAENLPDVAEALNMPRDATRASVLQRARELKGMGGRSGIFLPFAAGAAAYGLSGRSARAADGSEIGPTTADRLTSAGVAAGTSYGAGRVLNALDVAGKAAGGMLEPIAAMGIDPLEGATREETAQKIGEARGQASYYAPGLSAALGIPRSEGTAYDISRNPPSPNPLRTEPSPGNQYYPLSSPLTERRDAPSPTAADQDVGRAWARSPRATVIELTRGSGLDPEDIAHLAGVSPDEVHSVLQGIPQGALAGR